MSSLFIYDIVFFIWPNSEAKLLSASSWAGAIVFCSKKAAFGGSYPGYVKVIFCGAGTYCSGIGFMGMNWLGTMGVAVRYVGVFMIACEGSTSPPPLGLACLVKVIISAKTLSNVSMFTVGILLRKIVVR